MIILRNKYYSLMQYAENGNTNQDGTNNSNTHSLGTVAAGTTAALGAATAVATKGKINNIFNGIAKQGGYQNAKQFNGLLKAAPKGSLITSNAAKTANAMRTAAGSGQVAKLALGHLGGIGLAAGGTLAAIMLARKKNLKTMAANNQQPQQPQQ